MLEFRWALCREVATLYRPQPDDGTVQRIVLRGVQLDSRRRAVLNRSRQDETTGFLLVIPAGAAQQVPQPGDRVLPGEGPEVTWENWAAFSAAHRDALATVQYVDPKARRGIISHWEVGGWWGSGSGARSLYGN